MLNLISSGRFSSMEQSAIAEPSLFLWKIEMNVTEGEDFSEISQSVGEPFESFCLPQSTSSAVEIGDSTRIYEHILKCVWRSITNPPSDVIARCVS
jgi:hypothetical protein